jgi:hypothetical protein
VDGHWVGDGGHHVDDLPFDELKESKPQAEATFYPNRDVAKDKETAIRVIDILKAVKGRDDSTGEGTVGGGDDLAIGVVSMDQVAAHEQIRALQVIPTIQGIMYVNKTVAVNSTWRKEKSTDGIERELTCFCR